MRGNCIRIRFPPASLIYAVVPVFEVLGVNVHVEGSGAPKLVVAEVLVRARLVDGSWDMLGVSVRIV
jgi:hypothetical protein